VIGKSFDSLVMRIKVMAWKTSAIISKSDQFIQREEKKRSLCAILVLQIRERKYFSLSNDDHGWVPGLFPNYSLLFLFPYASNRSIISLPHLS
jgi:hypothetical protein